MPTRLNARCERERNGASGSGQTASGGTIMETGIAPGRPAAAGYPLAAARPGRLVNAGKPKHLLIVPTADPAGNCPSRSKERFKCALTRELSQQI
jgi:hypothetical protein